ncbi:LicD family protein [Neisseria lisongii]|uniref:LicD family protein n=1 Tax=Neisseria lisongii TaxID=2912188 RepID=A0AAW5AG36_9NEIS|nr:LicD family protein [Neisseria lisongii]MCF7530279.1 LicD family protein [Neisseria lisongii]
MKEISLREQQLISLDILTYFDEICEKNNIKYSLGGGTLIGAVRHQGFIPWDDDIDVYMLRDEYLRFIQIWKDKDTEHSYYKLSSAEDINGTMVGEITKIFDTRTYLLEPNGKENSIFIDIFILDYVPNEPNLIFQMMKKHRRLKLRLTSCRKKIYKYKDNKILHRLFTKLTDYFFNKMTKNLELFRLKYTGNNCDYICLVMSDYYGNWEKSYMPKEYFLQFQKTKFENKLFPITSFYDQHLTEYYGNYMELPPEKDRRSHHTVKVCWK